MINTRMTTHLFGSTLTVFLGVPARLLALLFGGLFGVLTVAGAQRSFWWHAEYRPNKRMTNTLQKQNNKKSLKCKENK